MHVSVGLDQRIAAAWPFSEHQINPANASFGAHTFSSEGSGRGPTRLEAVTGHTASPATEAALIGKTTNERGYLDRHTTALRNTAASTLGLTDQMVGQR